MTLTIIASVFFALLGALITFLALRGRIEALTERTRQALAEGQKASALADRWRADLDGAQAQRAELMSQRDVLQSRVDGLSRQMLEMRSFAESQQEEIRRQFERRVLHVEEERDRRVAELRTQYERQLEQLRAQHQEMLDQQAALFREQVNTVSEEVLKKRATELSAANTDQLSAILTPLRDHLRQMQEAVERSDRAHTTSMERLDASIKANLEQAREVGERADKLVRALTSDSKTQGNFGELRLRTLLEGMGFEEGTQFEEQTTLRDATGGVVRDDDDGRRMIPDVILHFPDKRDVIIDSKVSMTAFEDYFNAEGEQAREEALKRHLLSVRNHVRELAHKNYSQYMRSGRQKPDFVVMYVYQESALQLALAHDATLYRDAYDAGVIIAGSQSMYMMLRVLEMTWRQVRQAENQEDIMKAANELVNRVQMFYERFMAVDEQLKRTQEAFSKLRVTTAPTGSSIITAANRLLRFGAKENPKRTHHLPKE